MDRARTMCLLGGAAVIIGISGCGPSATPAASGWQALHWERIDASAGSGGPLDVVELDGRYVGVGGSSAWISSDLRAWREVDLGGPDATPIVTYDGALLAAGTVGGMTATVLRSDNGDRWTSLGDDAWPEAAQGFASTSIVAIAAGPTGVVAVGTEWGDAGQRPAAWFSSDGRIWERAAEPLAGSGARDVISVGTGFVMAGAGNARSGEATRALFWTSADGRAWTPAEADPAFGNAEPATLAQGEDGTIVAAGFRITSSGLAPALWTSSDARVWTSAPEASSLGPWAAPGPTPITGEGAIQGTSISSVIAVSDGYLAAGQRWGLDPGLPMVDGPLQMSWHAVVWHSGDGKAWDLLPDDAVLSLGVSGSFGFGPRHVRQLGRSIAMLGMTAELGATIWLADNGFDQAE